MYFSPPAILVAIGGIFAVVGAFWGAVRQSARSEELAKLTRENRDLTQQIAENDPKKTALLQDIAAHMGNEAALKELIDTRSRLLALDRRVGDSLLNEVLTQLPATTAQYRKLDRDIAAKNSSDAAEFKLSWEPFIRFAMAEFDRCGDELSERKIPAKLSRAAYFDLTRNTDTQTSYDLRAISIDQFTLKLVYLNAVFSSRQTAGAELSIQLFDSGIGGNQMWIINLGSNQGRPNSPNPKEGIPTREITETFKAAIAKGIERILVLRSIQETR